MKAKKMMRENKYKMLCVIATLAIAVGITLSFAYYQKTSTLGHQELETPVTTDNENKASSSLDELNSEIKKLKKDRNLLENDYASAREQLDQLQSMIADFKRDIKMAESEANAASILTNDRALDSPMVTDETELQYDPEIEEQKALAQMMAQFDLLKETLAEEETDPEWSIWAEESLLQTFQGEQAGGLLVVDLACRSTLCRVELILDGSTPAEESFRNLSLLTPWEGEGFVSISGLENESEAPKAVVYLARDGYMLPQFVSE